MWELLYFSDILFAISGQRGASGRNFIGAIVKYFLEKCLKYEKFYFNL